MDEVKPQQPAGPVDAVEPARKPVTTNPDPTKPRKTVEEMARESGLVVVNGKVGPR